MRSAERDLDQLGQDLIRRVDSVLTKLSLDPRPHGSLKLEGKESHGWRVRVGDYRILYTIDDASRTITVYRIGHRSDVYR